MSVNKNFVVKNGFEVSTDLILANADTNKVGIATTVPQYTLHINGGIGATDVYVTGISTLGVTSATNLTSQQLNVSGISTLGVTSTTNLTSQQLNVSGISTFYNLTLEGTVSAGNTIGEAGQILISTGVGVTWKDNITFRTSTTITATQGQTTFSALYSVGFVDVFITGIKLSNSEFTAINGTDIILNAACFGGELVEIIAYEVQFPLLFEGITVKEEGSSVGTNVNTINFVGNTVTATTVGTSSTISIDAQPPITSSSQIVAGIITATAFDGNINAGVGTITTLNGATATYTSGIVTTLTSTNASLTNINSSGISTLGVTSTTDLTAQQLNVSGITTTNSLRIAATQVISSTRQLQNIASLDATTTATIESAISNAPNTFTDLQVTGISTLGVTSTTDLRAQQLNVSGIGTITTLTVGDINSSGIVTATTFVGALTGTATSTTNIPNLTGDITSSNTITTLATVNSNVGTFGSSTAIPSITVNAKGLVTGISTSAITVGDGTLTLATSGTGLSGSQTFTANQSGSATFTVTSNATSANTVSTIVARDGAGGFSAGIITATQLSTGDSGVGININTNTITGPATLTIDPAGVGDNTGAVRIKGDLYIDGNQFVVNSSTIELADLNVGIATTVGTNALLDGGGIGIGSANIRKTLQWENSSSSLKSSEDFNLASGKSYEINGASVLSATTLGSSVVNSSLTSVGTITTLTVGDINSSGIVTATIFNGNINAGVGTITTLNGATATYSTGNFTTGNILTGIVTTLTSTNASLTNINSSGISTLGVTSTTDLTAQQLNVSGIGDITTLNSTSGTITNLIGTAGTITTLNSTSGTITNLNVGNVNSSGIITATGGFVSTANTTPITIELIGNQLTFNAVGIGSTTLTLF